MTAAVVAPLAGSDPGRHAALAAAPAVWWACYVWWPSPRGSGFVADLLSKPIIVGYLAGVAVIMIVGQLHRTTPIAEADLRRCAGQRG
jgi:sulfate permease, SulP family